jgi:hypothetical protein
MSNERSTTHSSYLTRISTLIFLAAGSTLTVGIAVDQMRERESTSLSATGMSPFDAEVKALMATAINPPPVSKAIQQLVASGFPKSIDDAPRARASHATLNAWGHDAIVKAFRAALDPNPARKRALAHEVRHTMLVFTDYGTNFGDFYQRPYDYGNVNLELVWFLGNLTRAVHIIDTLSQDPRSGIYGALPKQDKERFSNWLRAMESRYTSPRAFPSGKSNRKASQLELQLRSAALRKDHGEIRRLVSTVIPRFINMSISDQGIIYEDTPRDKYHPQFFLASALQSLEIGKRYGVYLDWKKPQDKLAINRLASALAYSAFTNMNALPPKGFESMQDTRPNYEIPFWYLAPRFYKDYSLPIPADVLKMVGFNYADPSRFDFTLMWGFNAIATAKGL